MMQRLLRISRWTLWALAALAAALILALVAFRVQAVFREGRAPADAAPTGGRFVKAAGLDIFVQEMGPKEAPAVVFIHGPGAWSEAWRSQMTALAKGSVRAIALDLPPFGYSQRPDPPSYGKREQGLRILAVLDALGLQRAVLVGHSFGAGPAVEAALAAPERVRALILVDAALGINWSDDPPDAPALLRGFLGARPLRDSVVATFLTNPLFTRRLLQSFIDDPQRATDEWVSLYQRPLVVKSTTAAVGEWLPALLLPGAPAASENPASYKSLKPPVFIVWGGRDTITPAAQGRILAAVTPGAELVVMREVGHIPQIEDAAGFNRALLLFVAKADAAP